MRPNGVFVSWARPGRGSVASSRFRRDPTRPDPARPGPTRPGPARPGPTGHFGYPPSPTDNRRFRHAVCGGNSPPEESSWEGLLPGRTPPREQSPKAGGRKSPKLASQNRPSSVREGGWPGRVGPGRAGSGRVGPGRDGNGNLQQTPFQRAQEKNTPLGQTPHSDFLLFKHARIQRHP